MKTQGRQHRGVRVQISTTPTTIPTLRILKCNNASLLFFAFIYLFYCLHIVYLHWNEKVKRKIEIFFAFSTLRIFHTPRFPHPHFPHPAFSTLRTPPFPLNPACKVLVSYHATDLKYRVTKHNGCFLLIEVFALMLCLSH